MELPTIDYGFEKLPSNILTNVLAHLTINDLKNAVLTCKPWYNASFDPKIYKNILVNSLNDATCINFLQRPIRNIRLSAVNINKFPHRKLFLKFGHTIVELDLLFTKFAITRLFEMFIYLPNIELLKIHFTSTFFSAQNFYRYRKIQLHWKTISHNLEKIKLLTVHTRLKDLRPMTLLMVFCKNVQTLNWNEWFNPPVNQNEFLCHVLLEPSKNGMLNNLTELLIGCIDQNEYRSVIKKLANITIPNLKKLTLKELSVIHYDPVFCEFCKRFDFLKDLTISGCNEHHLNDICNNMVKLKSLAIDNCAALNLARIANLLQLETLHLSRSGDIHDEQLIELLSLKLKRLAKLSINIISTSIMKCICTNYPNLEELKLDGVEEKWCDPIFHHLTELKVLHLAFMEPAKCHSSQLISSDKCNISRLIKLNELVVSCWVPGITPSLVHKLPNINIKHLDSIYDPTEEEFAEWRLGSA